MVKLKRFIHPLLVGDAAAAAASVAVAAVMTVWTINTTVGLDMNRFSTPLVNTHILNQPGRSSYKEIKKIEKHVMSKESSRAKKHPGATVKNMLTFPPIATRRLLSSKSINSHSDVVNSLLVAFGTRGMLPSGVKDHGLII